MTIQANGATLVENVAVPIDNDLKIVSFWKGPEYIIFGENGRGSERPGLWLTGLDGLVPKYNRFGESGGNGVWFSPSPVYLDPRRMFVRRFVPPALAIAAPWPPVHKAEPNVSAGLFSGPLGMIRPMDVIGYNATNSNGVDPFQAHDELRGDLCIERDNCFCTDHERVDSYIRLIPGYGKTLEFKDYCAPIPSTGDPDDRQPVNITPVTAQYAAELLSWRGRDGQHWIRDYRYMDRSDPAHARYLATKARYGNYAWDNARASEILARPPYRGGAEGGRESAWVLELAIRVRDSLLGRRMKAILDHIALPNGITQAVGYSTTTGFTPDPWKNGVDKSVRVAQDFEQAFIVFALQRSGMNALAAKLAHTIYVEALSPPGSFPKKWIDADRGLYIGTNSQTNDEVWPGLSSGVRAAIATGQDYTPFLRAFRRFVIAKPLYLGGSVGPFNTNDPGKDFDNIHAALVNANQPGKFADAIRLVEELT